MRENMLARKIKGSLTRTMTLLRCWSQARSPGKAGARSPAGLPLKLIKLDVLSIF